MSIIHTMVNKVFLCEMKIEVKLNIPIRKVDKQRLGANFNGTFTQRRRRKLMDFSNRNHKLQNSASNRIYRKITQKFYPLLSITDNFYLSFLWSNCAIISETRSSYEKVALLQH